MDTTRAEGGSGGDSGDGDAPFVVPLSWQLQVLLLLRVECLFGAAQKAAQGGDEATAARLMAEAKETIKQAREAAERARAQ